MTSYCSTGQLRVMPIGLVLINVILHAIIAEGFQFVPLTHKLPLGESSHVFPTIIDSTSYVSPGMVYGACRKNASDEANYDCAFAMETNSNVDSLKHLRFCNFTINAGSYQSSESESYYFSVFAIDEDKAILQIHFRSTINGNISILHFSDCRAIPVDIDGTVISGVNPPLSGVLEIGSSKMGQNGREIRFLTLIDFEGNIVTEKQKSYFYEPIGTTTFQSPLEKRLLGWWGGVYGKPVKLYTVEVMHYNGSTELIRQYPMDQVRKERKEEYGISPTHQLLSVCTISADSTIHVGQFDLNGVLKFELNLTLSTSWDTYQRLLNCYNLPGGGLLLLTYNCYTKNPDYVQCTENADDYHYKVEKFDKEGHRVGLLEFKEFPVLEFVSKKPKIHFFENEKKEMCLSLLNTIKPSSNNQITLDVACFDEKDFSP